MCQVYRIPSIDRHYKSAGVALHSEDTSMRCAASGLFHSNHTQKILSIRHMHCYSPRKYIVCHLRIV